jgi:hypothetical protein
MTVVRFALFIFVVLAASFQSALAGSNCMSASEFEKHGGKVVRVDRLDLENLPYNFSCDFVPCFGALEYSGTIDATGNVRNLTVTHNTWAYRPDYHASVIAAKLEASRYAPPKLHRRSVCVDMKWHVEFSRNGVVSSP